VSSNVAHATRVAGEGAAHAPDEHAQDDHARDDDGPGLLASAELLWDDVRVIAHEHLRLVALEARRAGRSLAWLLIYAILAGGLSLGAWAGALAALVVWLIGAGLPASGALLIAALLNIGAAGLCVLAIRRHSRHLGFPATVRSLQPDRAVAAAARRP
jgi:uncharacterized membrane protein YqjE